MVALNARPRGIDQEAAEAKNGQQRINPPRVAPGGLSEAATLQRNIDRGHVESSGYRNRSSEVKRLQGYTMVRSGGKKKPDKYDIPTEIRRLARERVGAVAFAQAHCAQEATQEAQAQAAAG